MSDESPMYWEGSEHSTVTTVTTARLQQFRVELMPQADALQQLQQHGYNSLELN